MTIKELRLKNLPDTPGVYFFVGNTPKREILYIGRATSLKDRTKSYFADDLIHTRGSLIVDMVFHAADVDFVETPSVLEAIILEANLIKKHQPHFNTKEKDDKSFNYVVITKEAFPKVFTMRAHDLEQHLALGRKAPWKVLYTFGPYTQGTTLRDALKIIRKIIPFRDAKCEPEQGKPCFSRQIGLCPGVCTGEISEKEYMKHIRHIVLFFEGKKSKLIKTLEREMNAYAKAEEFEKAHEVKKTIFALDHIQDISLIRSEEKNDEHVPDDKNPTIKAPKPMTRIEAYDIAHLSGKNMVGVMTVLEGRSLSKANYRMFKVRGFEKADDIGALKEVLSRRLNHPEWTYPNIIAVDGALPQLHAAEELLKERGFDIAVVAVVKNERHQPDRILGDKDLIQKYKKEILLLNSEAHRFAITYHRKLRRIIV